jgi:filamentous hemagglutinin
VRQWLTPKPIGWTGRTGESALKRLGGQSQVYFRTSQGGRYVDQLVSGIAHEAKVGYQALTPGIQQQIAKDVELVATGQIKGSVWHFFRSPVTGQVGPSSSLAEELARAGIQIIFHP